LSVLSQEQIKATFYLIGVEMVRHPAAADAIIRAGHEVGNHGYTHSSLMFMDPLTLSREITRTDALLRQHGYLGDITIRPPYGHKLFELPIYAAQHNRQLVMWDFPLGTESGATVDSIVDSGVKQTRPGSIIIMHVMYDHNQTTLNAVQPLIQKLKAKGYRFVTVSELLSYRSS
jgi:peptidoglycan/xylan/chitin deacetylase (PgdA/CDA1 family)